MFKKLLALFILFAGVISSTLAFDVTFSVDLNGSGLTNPSLNGNFNVWCGYCAPMSDANADGIWEITVPLAADTYEYKFTANAGTNWESLTPGSICTVTAGGYTNRIITVTANTVLPTVCWGRCYACGVATPNHDVTFQLDMQNVTGFNTPEVKGSFNGWCSPTCNPMSDANNDNIWEVTVTIPEGNYEYKFAYDNWTGQENLTPGSSCTKTTGDFTNRTLAVTETSTLPVVCWGSCSTCPGPPVFVTFQVDMSNVTGFTTPYLIGTFNGWCGNCNPLTDVGNGIWEIMMSLSAGDYEYKFTYDNGAGSESLTQGSSCTITSFGYTNRKVTVESSDIELGVVCWGSCAACDGIVTNPCDILSLPFDEASSLSNWSTDADAMLPEASMTWDASGALRISGSNTSTDIGKAYIFQYLNNAVNYNSNSTVQLEFDVKSVGALVEAALQLQTEIPGAGVVNTNNLETAGINENTWTHFSYTFNGVTAASLFRMHFNMAAGAFLGAGGTLLIDNIELNCFNPTEVLGCTDATATNYNPAATEDNGSCLFATTFNADMNCTDPFTNVYITGPWCEWCGAESYNLLTDPNADGIFNVTLNFPAGNVEYKYMVDNFASQENLIDDMLNGGTCAPITDYANYANREIVVGTTTYDTYGSCSDCGSTATPVNVTFQLDMAQYIGSFTTPHVGGTFNAWCQNCAPMSDANGDNKWELTIPLIPDTYEYKFALDSWNAEENLVDGSTCTITTGNFINRTITVTDAETLPAVCWESCELCIDFVDETSNTLSVYPNPSNGNIRINSNLALPYNVEVFDLSGRKVQDMKVFQSNTEINLENLAKGAYQIRVSNNNNSVRETVIIK